MKSDLIPRDHPKIDSRSLRIRIIQNKVEEGFNKIFVGNLPQSLQQYEVIDILSNIGELKGLEPIQNTTNIKPMTGFSSSGNLSNKPTQYFVSFKNNDRID